MDAYNSSRKKGSSSMSASSRLVKEIHPGIYKIQLPFPGDKPGPINVYLFTGGKATLLDTGMLRTFRFLKRAFSDIGYSFSDIGQIIISHGHIDHYGAARKIVRATGGRAVVGVHSDDLGLVESGDDVPARTARRFLKMMGVPRLYINAMELIRWGFRFFADNCSVDFLLNDNDTVTLGDYTGRVISTPGHSRGSVCVYLEKENLLFAGDHILEHITPNALVMLESGTVFPGRLSQEEYYNSLSKIEGLGEPVVYTGHGKDVHDLKSVTALYRDQFRERQEMILSVLDSGEASVYRIARRVFPDLSGFNIIMQIYLSVSEVFTHLQVLEREKRASFEIRNNRLSVRRIE